MKAETLLEILDELDANDLRCFLNMEYDKKNKSLVVSDIISEDENLMMELSERFDYIPVTKEPAHDFIPDLFTISFF